MSGRMFCFQHDVDLICPECTGIHAKLAAAERERDEAREWSRHVSEVNVGILRARDRAEQDAARLAAEFSDLLNDGSVLCGCRQHPCHGASGYVKQDFCSGHAALAAHEERVGRGAP